MALSATVTIHVEDALKSLLRDPVVSQSVVNRDNAYLVAEPSSKGKIGLGKLYLYTQEIQQFD